MKNKNYTLAPEVEEVAKGLISRHHRHLCDAKIAYVFKKDSWNKNGKWVLGSAHKCSEKEKLLHNYDFIITINYDSWRIFDEVKQEAVVDHELCHCGKDKDDKYVIISHDIEDFAAVIRRHGLYTEDVKAFGMAINQVSLFNEGPNLRVVGSE